MVVVKQTKKIEEMKTYIIEGYERTRRIKIPSSWEVAHDVNNPNILHIYETKDQQRACFVGVKSFYDISIKCQKLITNKAKNNDNKSTTGTEVETATSSTTELTNNEWINSYPE